jgi:hypothetical protein
VVSYEKGQCAYGIYVWPPATLLDYAVHKGRAVPSPLLPHTGLILVWKSSHAAVNALPNQRCLVCREAQLP